MNTATILMHRKGRTIKVQSGLSPLKARQLTRELNEYCEDFRVEFSYRLEGN